MRTSIGLEGSRNTGVAGSCALDVTHNAASGSATSHFLMVTSPGSPQRADFAGSVAARLDAHRVAEGAAEALVADPVRVAVGERDAAAEAERVRAEVVDVHVAGPAVRVELEVVVLEVAQAVAHLGLAARHRALPD